MGTGSSPRWLRAGIASVAIVVAGCTSTPGAPSIAPVTAGSSNQPAATGTAVAATGTPAAAGVIKIGVPNTFTGPQAEYGEFTMNGVMLALDEKGDSVAGSKFEFIKSEDQCTPEGGANAANKLIGQVVAAIGPTCSGAVSTAGPILAQAKIPYLTEAYLPALTEEQGTDYIFRNIPSDRVLMGALAEEVKKHGHTKIALANDTTTFSAGESAIFAESWKGLGMPDPVAAVTWDYGASDWAGQIEKIRQTGAEAIVILAYEADAAGFVKQTRQLALDVPFFGGYAFGQTSFAELVGSAADGSLFVTNFLRTAPEVKGYADKYQTKYGIPASTTDSSPYASMLVLIDAFTRAGPTASGEQLRDAIRATNITTPVWPAAFNAKGDLKVATIWIGEMQGGQPVEVERKTYDAP
ncbi:MAG: branched-chain amino acid transport system substrate-binding protein [Chloroflexota bacterium]|nr:branched-chain amino acid transport system substrate-binding protein [Chloroflexota bacterium]